MLYSKTANGFYNQKIHGSVIPDDAVSITNELYANLLNGQASGKVIQLDQDGNPILVDPPLINVIPSVVTMRQARLALLSTGFLDDVNAVLNAIADESQRQAAIVEWEYAATVDRDSKLVTNLASALQLDNQQLDELFISASQL